MFNSDLDILLPTLGIVIEAEMTQPTCNGSSDASIDVTVTQGTAPFTFQWSTGESSSGISGIGAGTYAVTVTDAGGCSATTSIEIEEPKEIVANLDSLNELECNGDSTGSIFISVTGGTLPYQYAWSNGDTTKDLTGIIAGEYCVVITDANGCVSDTFCFTLNEPPPPQIQPDITQLKCNGGDEGSISVTVTGGTAPYTYLWNTNDTLPTISGLAAGSYSLTATDQNGCTTEGSFTINEPDSVIVTVQDSSYVICNGDSTGTIFISVTGGTAPYNYDWSNGDTTQNLSGLGAGDYQVTVTDANGCVDSSDIVTLVENDSILIEATIKDVVCPGDSNGSIIIMVSGGTSPYTYEWSNGASDTILIGLGGGPHTVTVTDSVGCQASKTFNVIDPPIDDVRIDTVQTLKCPGDSIGILCAIVDGVPPPFTYTWSTGDTTRCISGLGAGTYSVTVADDDGCLSFFNNFVLSEPDPITPSISVTGITCFDDEDGTATVSVTGGTPPYTFQWSNGDTGNQADNLPVGSVTVTVTDASECSATLSANITEPLPFNFGNSETDNNTCDTITDGSITVVVTGGTAPYTYLWEDGPSGSIREDLGEGTYTITVSDANECSASTSFTIDGPPCNSPPVAVDDTTSLFVCLDQSIDIAVLDNDYDPDGDDIYVSSILGAPFHGTVHVNSEQTITYVPEPGYIGIDTFTYIICEIGTQPSLCDSADVIVAVLPCRPNVEIPTGVSPNGDGVNDFFDIPGIEFFPNNVLLIFNRWGNKVKEYHGYNNEWRGTNESDEPLPDGTYYFILELHDDANTTYTGYIVVHR